MFANVLLVISVIVFLFACLCLLVPGLRLKSVAVWAVSVLLFWAAYALDQPPSSAPQLITTEQRDRNIERQRQQRAAELGISVDEVAELEARERAEAAERQRAEEERRERQRAARERREREGSMARQQMERLQRELDNPIGPILERMPGIPQRGRMGDARTFTYTLRDGSRLILAARPRGSQTGLILHYVDVEED